MDALGEFAGQFEAANREVMADIRGKLKAFNQGPSAIEEIKRFAAAVDWTERWIQALLGLHLLLLLTVVLGRCKWGLQTAVFFAAMLLIYSAERLNRLAGAHWQAFSQQNYFDPAGIFASALLSAPLLLIMFVVLINYLVGTVQLLVKMKRAELIHKARQRQREERAQQGGSGGGGGGSGAGKKEC